ncbi:glycosyltransferase [Candidatus Poribacteria bacterium]|nr:glycosyltransferase [Candidatus Poribacteria bacterium]
MRILYVIDSMAKDGAESQLLKTLERLNPDEYEAYVILSRTKGERFKDLTALPCVRDVTILKSEGKKRKILEKAFALGGVIKAIQPDLVHSWLWYSNFLSGLSYRLGLWGRIPLIVSQRGDYHARYSKFRLWITEKFIYNAANILLTNSKQIQQHLQNLYPQKTIYSIPNLLELPTEEWSPNQRDSSEKRIVCVGRFSHEKGHRYLIKALYRIDCKDFSWQCVFLGDGELQSELTNLTDNLNLSDKITFLGFCDDVYPVLLQADLFVLPSLHEGSPNALIEAMGLGLPCIASDVGGIKDLIDNEINGILVPPKDSDALSNALQKLITDTDYSVDLGKNARKTIQQKFNNAESIQKLIDIYQTLLCKNEA